MDRQKFKKASMCLKYITKLITNIHCILISTFKSKFSNDKFVYKKKEDLPKNLRLDACSLCQLNCTKCWIRENEKQIKEAEGFGFLKFKNFKNLVDNNPQIEHIELSNNGEIFLNPELDKIIEYAYKKNIELSARNGVNLNYLTDEMAKHLVVFKFKKITVSIDGATQDTYKIYRRGGDFNKVISNIQKINKYKKLYNSEYPELTYKFIIFGHNEHEIELAKQKAEELGMRMEFMQNAVENYSPVSDKKVIFNKTGIDYDKTLFIDQLRNNGWYYCYELFEDPQIDWNGNLLGCCTLYDKDFGINVFEVGLMNALNSKKVIDAKNTVTNLSYKPKTDNPCINCIHFERLKKENLYIKKFA